MTDLENQDDMIQLIQKVEEIKNNYVDKDTPKQFWNENIRKNSQLIWLPSQNDHSFPNPLKKLDSWFTTDFTVATNPPPFLNSQEIEKIKKPEEDLEQFKSLKIRIYPNLTTKRILTQMFACSRWVYNNSLLILKSILDSPIYQENEEIEWFEKIYESATEILNLLKIQKLKKIPKLFQLIETNLNLINQKITWEKRKIELWKIMTSLILAIEMQDISDLETALFKLKREKKRIKNKLLNYKKNKVSNITVRDYLRKVQLNDEKEDDELINKYIYDIEHFKKFPWNPQFDSIKKYFHDRLYRGIIKYLVQDINSLIGNKRPIHFIREKTKKDSSQFLPYESWQSPKYMLPKFLQGMKGNYKIGRRKIDLPDLLPQLDKKAFSINYEKETQRYYLIVAITEKTYRQIQKPSLTLEEKQKVFEIQNKVKFLTKKEKLKLKSLRRDRLKDRQEIKKIYEECYNRLEKNNLKLPNEEKEEEKKDDIPKGENQILRIASLDPGVRTFMTCFNHDHYIEFAKNDIQRIYLLLLEKDQSLQPQAFKLQRKIKHLIDELHWKIIKYLTDHYDVILLPRFPVSKMIQGKKLPKSVKRMMTVFSFYKFLQKMKFKCQMKGIYLDIVNESYTTKTCTACGYLNEVGSKKIIKCKKCRLVIDRDVNAPRNGLLKRFYS